jgi:hypothetical protein
MRQAHLITMDTTTNRNESTEFVNMLPTHLLQAILRNLITQQIHTNILHPKNTQAIHLEDSPPTTRSSLPEVTTVPNTKTGTLSTLLSSAASLIAVNLETRFASTNGFGPAFLGPRPRPRPEVRRRVTIFSGAYEFSLCRLCFVSTGSGPRFRF